MEYPMQTGSGTMSVLPGLMYLGQAMPWSWGVEGLSTQRIGHNTYEYRLGNQYEARAWLARQLTGPVTLAAGTFGESWGDIKGSDVSLDPSGEPT